MLLAYVASAWCFCSLLHLVEAVLLVRGQVQLHPSTLWRFVQECWRHSARLRSQHPGLLTSYGFFCSRLALPIYNHVQSKHAGAGHLRCPQGDAPHCSPVRASPVRWDNAFLPAAEDDTIGYQYGLRGSSCRKDGLWTSEMCHQVQKNSEGCATNVKAEEFDQPEAETPEASTAAWPCWMRLASQRRQRWNAFGCCSTWESWRSSGESCCSQA